MHHPALVDRTVRGHAHRYRPRPVVDGYPGRSTAADSVDEPDVFEKRRAAVEAGVGHLGTGSSPPPAAGRSRRGRTLVPVMQFRLHDGIP